MASNFHERYTASVATPVQARQHIANYLRERGRAELIPTAMVLVSELVTNAVIHAGGIIDVRAWLVGSTLHVEVADQSNEMPRMQEPAVDGRGLHIVEALAVAWGTNPVDGYGKSTWFDLEPD